MTEAVRMTHRELAAQDQYRLGYLSRAAELALGAHQDAMQANDLALAGRIADFLSPCLKRLAKFEEAIGFTRQALAYWEGRGNESRHNHLSGLLAMLLAFIGADEAIEQAEIALDAAERAGVPSDLVWALQCQCTVFGLLRQPDRGLPFGERAIAISREYNVRISTAYINVAETWACLGLHAQDKVAAGPTMDECIAKALPLAHEALAIARDDMDGWSERLAINNIADYHLHMRDASVAEAILAQFEAVPGEPTHRCLAAHHFVRSRLATTRQDHKLALEEIEAAITYTSPTDLEMSAHCYRALADCQERVGNYPEALRAHRTFHDVTVRQASEATLRRARIHAARRETEEIRAAALQAEAKVNDLAASNEMLQREAARLLRSSLEDPLTGLPNRRQLDVAFLDLLTSAAPFALAMIDVDHFKRVNDRFSHPVGDTVLRAMGNLLAMGARKDDLIVRYGGEEFAVLMRNTDLDTAHSICERLRDGVRRHPWSALRDGLHITISIGIAAGGEADSHQAVLALADQRLYRAKQTGRDRVVLA